MTIDRGAPLTDAGALLRHISNAYDRGDLTKDGVARKICGLAKKLEAAVGPRGAHAVIVHELGKWEGEGLLATVRKWLSAMAKGEGAFDSNGRIYVSPEDRAACGRIYAAGSMGGVVRAAREVSRLEWERQQGEDKTADEQEEEARMLEAAHQQLTKALAELDSAGKDP